MKITIPAVASALSASKTSEESRKSLKSRIFENENSFSFSYSDTMSSSSPISAEDCDSPEKCLKLISKMYSDGTIDNNARNKLKLMTFNQDEDLLTASEQFQSMM